MKLDAHHYFWRYTPEDFGWITAAMAPLRRHFSPADFAPLLQSVKLDGTVAVQARAAVAETDWLLELAAQHAFIRGVVGWVPLHDPKVDQLLEVLADNRRFKGVRHGLQDEPSVFMESKAFNAGLEAVAARGLAYDLLVFARQLPAVIELVDRHPRLRFVVDHIAKPIIAGPPPAEWRRDLAELARRPHVCCKFSGLVTEVRGPAWTPELLWPYFDVVLDAFGADRLMFGSDWPVCLVAADYKRWFRFVESCVEDLDPAERDRILGGTAAEFYRL
jgi:L-fuconolactonase